MVMVGSQEVVILLGQGKERGKDTDWIETWTRVYGLGLQISLTKYFFVFLH